jgi:magnesium transporter
MNTNHLDISTQELLDNFSQYHAIEIANKLKHIYKSNKDSFFEILHKIPDDLLGDVLLELPETLRDKAYNSLSHEQITNALEELETDDATDIIQDLEDLDKQKAKDILNSLDQEDRDDINWLKKYDENEAGAYMQIELFSANINETIQSSLDRLKQLKKEHELENIHQVFIVDDENILIATISLEDLIIYDFNKTYLEIIEQEQKEDINKFKPFSVQGDDNIYDVVHQFDDYNLSVIAVTGYKNRLLGRITSDDILEIAEQNATEQIYQLAGVNDESEQEENLTQTGKTRASWLMINLFTAIMASFVIGIYEETLQQFIALAILMPIVASMGGNAGTQTLAVMVRQIALGDIDDHNSRDAIKKEIFLSIFNGMLFAVILALISYFWFNNTILSIIIALSIIITLFCAGFFGAIIPLLLKKFNIDPAIGSTVVLTTVTDMMGFFSFLGLAKILLVK